MSRPWSVASVRQTKAVLDEAQIRRTLTRAPRLTDDALIAIDVDESASVKDGNDIIGLRHELLLIALTHLSALRSRGQWYASISSFDYPSPHDLPRTRLDEKGLGDARRALLSTSPGGGSILKPSLLRAESGLAQFAGPSLLVVVSDFELFDSAPAEVLTDLTRSAATVILAISLGNEPPNILAGSRVHTARVQSSDAPSLLARHVVEAAQACISDHRGSSR